MKKQENTEDEKVVSLGLSKETKSILNRLINGEEVSRKELKRVCYTMTQAGMMEESKGGEINTLEFLDAITSSEADFVSDIVSAYIYTFNAIHETGFDSLEDIAQYVNENKGDGAEEDLEKVIREIVIKDIVRPKDSITLVDAITKDVFLNKATLPRIEDRKERQKKKHKVSQIIFS